jgi:hypothetical protein
MLEPLFDAELDYRPAMAPLVREGDGVLIGSGDGAVHGPRLTGKQGEAGSVAGMQLCAAHRWACSR